MLRRPRRFHRVHPRVSAAAARTADPAVPIYVRDLDPAALLRFAFKVEFLPLRPEQEVRFRGTEGAAIGF